MVDGIVSAFASTLHAGDSVVQNLASVSPGWLVAGVLLHTLHQVIRTPAWFNIIRVAYPEARQLRARDVTFAYLAGAGLNAFVPARGGDLAKLYLIRRRAPETRWSTLAATLAPETLFETAVGVGLVIWALERGLLPLPAAPGGPLAIDATLVMQHPFIAAAAGAAIGVACITLVRVLRGRLRGLLKALGQGMAILHRPRTFLCGVVMWQALARIVRLGSLACFLAAFALPVSLATVLLVMAAQGSARVVPVAPASVSLRIAMLTYAFAAVTGDVVGITRIAAFSFGMSAVVAATGLAITIAILGREFGTASPRGMVLAVRRRLGESATATSHARAA